MSILHRFYTALCIMLTLLAPSAANAQALPPDTVRCGTYITSIDGINFKEKEYNISLWIWLKYKNKKFDFPENLEVPQAKSVTRLFATLDTSNDKVYLLMKLQCTMKDSWAINNFPFDRQQLNFSIENSQFDSRSLIFVSDTFGKHFDPRFTLRGWHIDSLNIATGIKVYETGFGDTAITVPHAEYSNYKIRLQIDRDAMGLFWKMFLGMYVSFLIAYMCFYIHPDNIDSRFGLSVGSLFAVVGNKYIVDSALPESGTFTLVDALHGITLCFILIIIIFTSNTLRLIKQGRASRARKFDFVCAQVLLLAYIIINVYLIYRADQYCM